MIREPVRGDHAKRDLLAAARSIRRDERSPIA
jgi:hypothetical protein